MLVGTNPVVSHGYGTTLPDPSATSASSASGADRCGCSTPAAPRPPPSPTSTSRPARARDVALLAAVARALLDDGADPTIGPLRAGRPRDAPQVLEPFTVDRAAREPTSTADVCVRLLADVRAAPGRWR